MYVCVCLAVTDAEVEAAIAGGARDREAVTRACRAGGDCGACHGMIEQMIEGYLEEQAECPAAEESAPGPGLVPAAHLVRGRAA